MQNDEIKKLVTEAKDILIVQADNPDGDSLGSSLALEQILHKMDKNPIMYCGVDMPGYLRYLKGWDRVTIDLPNQFDLSIIVDTSSRKLLQNLAQQNKLGWLGAKPCIVLDHHGSVNDVDKIDFAKVSVNDAKVSSTGELVFNLAKSNQWPLDETSGEFIMTAILSDTQGLTNDLTSASTYKVMAELVELGVDRPSLEEKRRELSKMSREIFAYKAKLIERTKFDADGQIASVTIPHDEIMKYSPLYNPAPLIQPDMLQTEGVGIAIVFKSYNDGRITAAIRCNNGFAIGDKLAELFGGGGHPYASGFKIEDGRKLDQIQGEAIQKASELIDSQGNENHETV